MDKKIKVLHLLWFGRSGGAQRFVRDIIKYSDKDRFDHAVCFLSEGGAAAEEIARLGVKVYYLGMKNGLSILAGAHFIDIVNDARPDIINTHMRNYLISILSFFFPGIYKDWMSMAIHKSRENNFILGIDYFRPLIDFDFF